METEAMETLESGTQEPPPTTEMIWVEYAGVRMVKENFTMTEDMMFGQAQMLAIMAYIVMFIVGMTTNTMSLTSLLKERLRRKDRSKMTLLLIHLSVADLTVILFQVPLEIAWSATVSWWAGDPVCRIMVFLRILGFYASAFILIVISLDRVSAILWPITHRSRHGMTRLMLVLAWLLAPLCSLPQSFVFKVRSHPLLPEYKQCTTIGTFDEWEQEFAYFMFVMVMSMLLPVLIMLASYIAIVVVIFSSGVIGRAKMKTVKIMGILVLGFVLCWTPYYVMSIWWWAHQKTAEKLDLRVQKLLWAFACLNNCLNPLLYRMVGPYKPPAHRSLIQYNRRSQQLSRSRGSGRNTEATELQSQTLGRARLDSEDSQARETKTKMAPEASFCVATNLTKMMSDEVLTDLETATVNL